jgi:hypothetical protein
MKVVLGARAAGFGEKEQTEEGFFVGNPGEAEI